ncbi:MAG: universal stress protein [Gammaproteobacteria bacterium]|jgi:nucleotide-binding universal stress UspA family protein|nr:universal stress protein [Gammaproteobacteria bacterium]
MKEIKNILLCTHPEITDSNIVDRAAELARVCGAHLKVFHVVGGYPEDLKQWWNVRNPQKLHDKIQKEREKFVEGIVEQVRDRQVEDVSSEIRWGKEYVTIIEEVMRNPYDLVMLTARDRTQIAKVMFECPSRDLFLHCPCALWIFKSKKQCTTKRVVAALGGEGGHVECDGLNAKILKAAAAVAQGFGSELHIVHAMQLYGGKGIKKGGGLRTDLVDVMERLREDIARQCEPIMRDYKLKLDPGRIHLLVGKPVEVVPQFASDERMNLVVMGTAARTGLPSLIHANAAEAVLQQVDCGLLVVKPDDFVSMVEIAEHDGS